MPISAAAPPPPAAAADAARLAARRPRPTSTAAMRRAAIAPALCALLATAACATAEGFDARIATLVGLDEAALVRAIGVPDGEFRTADGRRFLQYDRLGSRAPTVIEPAFGLGLGYGWGGWGSFGTGIGFAAPAYAYPPPACSVTFEMAGGRVASYTRRGGGCVAVPPPPPSPP